MANLSIAELVLETELLIVQKTMRLLIDSCIKPMNNKM